MDSLRARQPGGGEDRGGVEVAVRGGRRPDAERFVGQAHVGGVSVRLRVHDDGLDAQFMAGPLYAQGDFAAVGDENLMKHARPRPVR